MKHALFVRRFAFAAVLLVLIASTRGVAQQSTSGDLAGVVLSDADKAVAGVAIHVVRLDGTNPLDATSDATGLVTIRGVPPGLYRLTARRLGFKEAQLPSLRVVAGKTSIRVTLTASATQLSTIEVRESATDIDSRSTELVE